GEAAIPGHLDDHAYLVWGLLELYGATFDNAYLERAIQVNATMLDHFWDAEEGGLFLTADDAEELLVRQKETYDGAMPSGNSVAMLNVLRLSHLTGDAGLAERASEMGRAFSTEAGRLPSGFAQMMSALDLALGDGQEVVIV
ncbi:MAG: thioredoxin domain-containing protein, partial [Thermoplasmata archaeon]|nr:thioredoxin domain-containing protein [Thermoplasmata archaeon]NIS13682.1 thioredoxin domain-containing protein [Thermoplasmata archaeon]NIS21556.1 thioredoxin domain-containing protein [Thermoplasmata archaeon]NIT79122.1 thioredoxin domain-containing protein [Thermoplasmata archaeon]NIU50595.1 thioredoxin domain-containing protein [Thermoplasmata archaeon]